MAGLKMVGHFFVLGLCSKHKMGRFSCIISCKELCLKGRSA